MPSNKVVRRLILLTVSLLFIFAMFVSVFAPGWLPWPRRVEIKVSKLESERPSVLVLKHPQPERVGAASGEFAVRPATDAEWDDYLRHPKAYVSPHPEYDPLRHPNRNLPPNVALKYTDFFDWTAVRSLVEPEMRVVHISPLPQDVSAGDKSKYVDVFVTTRYDIDGNWKDAKVITAPIARALKLMARPHLMSRDKGGKLVETSGLYVQANLYRAMLVHFASEKGQLRVVPTDPKDVAKQLAAQTGEYEKRRVQEVMDGDLHINDLEFAEILGLLKHGPPERRLVAGRQYHHLLYPPREPNWDWRWCIPPPPTFRFIPPQLDFF